MWYELETAASHVRGGDHGRALKNFSSVEKHFTDIVEVWSTRTPRPLPLLPGVEHAHTNTRPPPLFSEA